jgi:HAD superfamily hydrolase (TIGR01450 family)
MVRAVALSALLTGYDHVLLDLDGCVWVGGLPTPRAPEAVAAVRAAGKRVVFVTNDARNGVEDFVRLLWASGIQAAVEEVVSVGAATQHLLAERFEGARAVVIGSVALHRHVIDAGLRVVNGTPRVAEAGVVVVGVHDGFDYDELRDATTAVLNGATLIGAARDASFPQPDGLWPGGGALLAAVEVAAGTSAHIVVGKPEPPLFATALDRVGPGRALMVGDRLEIDVAGGAAAGIDAALVLSGGTTRADVQAWDGPAPVAVADTLADLLLA